MDIDKILKLNDDLQEVRERYNRLIGLRDMIESDKVKFDYSWWCNNSNRPFWTTDREILAQPSWNEYNNGLIKENGKVMTAGILKEYYQDIKEFYIKIIDKEIEKLEKEANKIFKEA